MKRGSLYEIILGFFLIIILTSAVVFFLLIDNQTSSVYASIKQRSVTLDRSESVLETLLLCHRNTYLDASLFGEPCAADTMGRGYRVTQHQIGNCASHSWDVSTGEYSSSVPYVVALLQTDGTKCLATVEVLLP